MNGIEEEDVDVFIRELENGNIGKSFAIKAAIEQERMKSNTYSSTKSVAQNFLDLALVARMIQTLVAVFSTDNKPLTGLEISLIVVVCIGLALQILLLVFISILHKTTGDKISRNCTAVDMNNTITSLSAIALVINIAITSIGAKLTIP